MPRPKKSTALQRAYETSDVEVRESESLFLDLGPPPYNLMESRPEMKSVSSFITTIVHEGGTAGPLDLYHISTVPRGAGATARVGARFILRHLRLHGYTFAQIYTGPTASSAISQVRWMLIWDKYPNKTPAKYEDIFTTAGSGIVGGAYAFPKAEALSRFEIIKDICMLCGPRVYDLAAFSATAVGSTPPPDQQWTMDVPLDHLAICSAGDNTGNPDGRIEGALYVAVFGTRPDMLATFNHASQPLHGSAVSYQLFYEDQ